MALNDNAPVALVTGAGSGIGQATARMLHSRGKVVLAGDISAGALEWATDVEGIVPIVADVSTENGNTALADAAQRLFGRLDVVVLNAGIAERVAWEADDAIDVFDRTMAINARGVMLGIRTCAPLIEASGGGSIVVVGSTSGVAGDPRHFAYNAAKAAAINLARAAAIDWAIRGVRVNVVAPGATMTPILQSRGLDPGRMRSLVSNVPLQRLATPEEQAEAICFLASDAASFITGAVLMSDGGLTANAGVFPPPRKVET